MTTPGPILTDGLARWAQRTPASRAVEDHVGNVVSYGELDALAGQVAHRLSLLGVGPGDRVGLCLPKCVNSVVSIYGILKAGAAYVPVDYSAPPQRNRFIFSNCQARVVITDEVRAPTLEADGRPVAPLLAYPGEGPGGVGAPWLEGMDPAFRPARRPEPDDLAYILYTSGSTGVPKGVMHSHASAMSFVTWAAETFKPVAADRFSSHAPFHFDLSVLDLYVPATAGAAVVVIGEDLGKEPHQLAEFIAERRLTVWYSVPSILALLVQFGRLDQRDYSALRTVLFAGEVFPIKHLRDLTTLWPDKAYYNLYGPTETNVCTFHRVQLPIDPSQTTPVPIGVPCSNVRARVWNERFEQVPPGEEGVLWIEYSGPTMLGYWGDPERTEASSRTDEQGRRWYCTGDVVIPAPDGTLTFVGRRDRMVKRRGYRIELGEIEAGLYAHPEIREAAAVATESPHGVVITAFVSPEPGAKLSIIGLKQYCATALPSYMNPDRFRVLDTLPRTSTDKVDYQGLKRMIEA